MTKKKIIRLASVTAFGLSATLCIVGLSACNKHEHSYKDAVTAPTCVAQGYTTKTCDCGDSYIDESSYVAALGHSYKDKVTEPTCEEQGYTQKVCERCQDSYLVEGSQMPAAGHTYATAWSYEEKADGVHWHEATCGHTSERGNEEKHTFMNLNRPATCESEGYTEKRCKCGYSYIDESTRTEKTDHAAATNWTTDYSYHWHVTNCTHAIVSDKAEHTFNTNNVCTGCGYTLKYTQGLSISYGVLSGFEDAAANATEIVVPAYVGGVAVTSVRQSALSGHKSVKSVVIPNTVTTLDNQIFYNCQNLEKVHLSSSLTTLKGSMLFDNCPKLTTVEIDGGNTALKVVDKYLVYNATMYARWGEVSAIPTDGSVTAIGQNFFKYSSIKTIDIPACVTSIGDAAFQGCESLTEVTGGSGLTSISGSAFLGCTSLKEFTVGDKVTRIGTQAFKDCTSLTKVHIGSNVRTIVNQAFNNCTALAELTVASNNSTYKSEGNCIIVKKDNSLLRGCNTSVIPATVKTIGQYAFYGAHVGEDFAIPATITSIGSYAFYGSTIKSVTIPSAITSIESYTFAECKSLTALNLGSVVTIKSNAFKNCTALTSVTVPESVTQIQGAFVGCTGITSVTFEVADGWKYDGKTNLSDMDEATKINNFTASYYWKRS